VTRYAKSQRAALADALDAVGPDSPTLCVGWTARDLAAHVVLRERDPIGAVGITVKPLADLTARRQARLAKSDYADLVRKVRNPPIWSTISNPVTDEFLNLIEMFVHAEDVRRAQPGWQPRDLDPGLTDTLWRRSRGMARFALRRFRATVTVEWPGHDPATAGAGGPAVTMRAEPAEFILFLYGRQSAANVEITGPAEIVDRLKRVRLAV
jgi:uncharacterized protein (TIGR03085 family)